MAKRAAQASNNRLAQSKASSPKPVLKKVIARTSVRRQDVLAPVTPNNPAIPIGKGWTDITATPLHEVLSAFPLASIIEVYLNLFYHPPCGGNPHPYDSGYLHCSGCDYKAPQTSTQYLGNALHKSEFRSKHANPTFLY